MKYLLYLSLFIIFTSCQDIKRQTQLKQIEQLEKTTDSIRKVYLENKNDSIGKIIASVMDVEFRIRRNYFSDTINKALGIKVNEYKMIRKKLKPIGKMYGQLDLGTMEELEALKKLKTDIQKNAGERSKYDEYIQFENEKVKKLNIVLEEMVKGQNKCMETYRRLHSEMNAFSLQLLEKNSKK